MYQKITKGGGAEAAGMTKGSVITAIDGTTVSSMDDLEEQLQYYAKTDEYDKSIALIDEVTPTVLNNYVSTFANFDKLQGEYAI